MREERQHSALPSSSSPAATADRKHGYATKLHAPETQTGQLALFFGCLASMLTDSGNTQWDRMYEPLLSLTAGAAHAPSHTLLQLCYLSLSLSLSLSLGGGASFSLAGLGGEPPTLFLLSPLLS